MARLSVLILRLTSAYLRTNRSAPGRWRLVRFALDRVRQHGPDLGRRVVATHYGFTMALDLRDWVDQHIFATGDYETSTAELIANFVEPGDTCVDAGANIGFFSLLMATRVGSTGAVWAFEPAPDTRARLLTNIELNSAGNIRVRPEALSNVEGEQRFWSGGSDHSGIGSLRPLDTDGASYDVRTARLANCLPTGVMPRLIKMDIEGAELLALQGMVDLLAAGHPDIVIEVSDEYLKQMGGSSDAVCSMLLALGYSMYVISWDGLVRCPGWTPSLPKQFNALFTTRTRVPARLMAKGH